LKPIEYTSPDGEAWVRVQAIPDYGMATIWDADILIWAASTQPHEAAGLNDLPRTPTTPYDLLRAIKRSTGAGLSGAASRAAPASDDQHHDVDPRDEAPAEGGFNWLDSWTFDTDADTEQPRGMTLTLSDWVYEGIVNEKSLLTMHPDYFLLSEG
jgi:plasmid replication initiation protein